MSATYAAYLPEEPLNFDTEYLHEVRDQDELSTPPSTAAASPAASIKLDTGSFPAKDTATPLPMGKFAILLMLNAVFPLSFEVVYPFVNAMIVEVGVTDDPERVGFYSGLVFFHADTFRTDLDANRWAAIKVMTGEMTDRSNQDLAFTLLSVSYRLGQISGLPLGGLLAHPEERFSWFCTAFWAKYPYLLPCLAGAAFAVLSILPGVMFIEETLPSKQRRKINKRIQSYGSTNSSVSSTSTLVAPQEQTLLYACEPTDIECAKKTIKPQSSWRSVLTPAILSLLVNNALMCFSSEMIFSVFPLFAYTPVSSGGLGMSEANIGTAMAIRSLIQVVLMLGYSQVISKMGTLRVYKLAMAFWVIVTLYFPLLNWIARTPSLGTDGSIFQASLLGFYVIWSIGGFCWTSSSSLVNNAAPSAEALSLTTGISQMTLVLPQVVSPALGNSLFAASVHQNILGGHLIWIVMLAMTIAGWFHSLSLTNPTHDWRENINNGDDE
ncbi:unnamed protein product [Rhizoctonia solani]|uniref:Uncharacterized protein n=1 Tax=Rhizoctonia solani TaxID=456999 RepID=A0A8H2WZF6_9AGAM|nr:unnamed protein product [Rhizoctonia solani]